MPATRLLVGSFNPAKVTEVRAALAAAGIDLPVMALKEVHGAPIYVEKGTTFEENAIGKVIHYSRYGRDLTLTDDSGLCVDALDGAPGVHSALYAAREHDPHATSNSPDADNNARLLRELATVPDEKRAARFVCVLAVAQEGRTLATFRGEAEGRILTAARGTRGFGYDPLFFSERLKKTFAELAPEEKAAVSHRGRAFARFLDWYRRRQPADV